MQLVVTRNILFPVALEIHFLRTHNDIISFLNDQLYLTNSSPKPAAPPINANIIYNTYPPPMNTIPPHHPHSHLVVPPDRPDQVINTAPVTIPPRANTIMTIPCTLPHSGNYLLEPSQQHFTVHLLQYTPVIIDAVNDNLPMPFINHSDREIVIPKHSYVGAMERVHESDQHIVPTTISPDPVSQHALSECLAHSDALPNQRESLCIILQENSGVFGSSIADLTSTPSSNILLTLAMLNPLSRQHTAPVTIIDRKLKNRWRRCYKTVLLNLALVLGPALLGWLRKQTKLWDSVSTTEALIKPL